MVWERYCNASPKPECFLFSVYIFIHISANMRPFGLKFLQMILDTNTSKRMYNWTFLFVVLHKPTLLPSTFKLSSRQCHCVHKCNIIGLSSFCIAPLSVPKVEVGERAAVTIVELGEERVNQENYGSSVSKDE